MENVINKLRDMAKGLKADLPALSGEEKVAHAALLNEVEHAIGCLRICDINNIGPNSKVIELPTQIYQTPSSEYRIIEDCETEDRKYWVEPKVNGDFIRLHQGSKVIL